MEQDEKAILELWKKYYDHPLDKLSYGGDGTLLRKIHFDLSKDKTNLCKNLYYPIRNYGRCEIHQDPSVVLPNPVNNPNTFNITKCYALECEVEIKSRDYCIEYDAMSEFVLKNEDPSECLRLDISVNDNMIYKNVMCDGLIIASPNIGSHGYFKSVTRTTFKQGIGLAFLNPTYGITNCILKESDYINITITRDTRVHLTRDKFTTIFNCNDPNDCVFRFVMSTIKYARIVGYNTFMCPKCRYLRNSTMLLNDQYIL